MKSHCRCKTVAAYLLQFLILAIVGLKSANAQGKLDAYYTATLLGLPIGHISWVVDLKEHRFSSVATGSIAGFLRLFLDAQGSVTAEGTPICWQAYSVQVPANTLGRKVVG